MVTSRVHYHWATTGTPVEIQNLQIFILKISSPFLFSFISFKLINSFTVQILLHFISFYHIHCGCWLSSQGHLIVSNPSLQLGIHRMNFLGLDACYSQTAPVLSIGIPKCQGPLGLAANKTHAHLLPLWSFCHLLPASEVGASPLSQCLALLSSVTLLHVPLLRFCLFLSTNPNMTSHSKASPSKKSF